MPPVENRPLLQSFPSAFWWANVMELFERGAYYGMNSILAVYLSNRLTDGGLAFSEDSVGFLQGVVYTLTYVVPILGGALADRYGYRKSLMVAFSLLAAGHFLTGQVSSYGVIFFTLMLMATGSGLFKPIISGTVARTTDERTSGIGFGIYYWMINLGAFVAPLITSYLKGFSWSYVFTASALYCAAMLIPTAFFFKEPSRPASTKPLGQVLNDAALVLGNARFMLLIFVYSGFWILYFQNFGSVLWFLRDFVDTAPIDTFFASFGIPLRFDAEHVTVINAGTIILLQVLVSRLVRSIRPLPTMVAGMLLGALGFVFLAFAGTIWIFVIGIVVFSIGEMTAHPKYYSYIGLTAPQDKKAVYMGYAFLYGVVGSLVGSNLGGILYERHLKPLVGAENVQPEVRSFWLLFAMLGLAATLGLVLYNRFFSEDTLAAGRLARRIMLGLYVLLILLGLAAVLPMLLVPAEMDFKRLMQGVIMLVIGIGGFLVTRRSGTAQ